MARSRSHDLDGLLSRRCGTPGARLAQSSAVRLDLLKNLEEPRKSGATVPLAVLKKWVGQFVHEREWEKSHTPKNLTAAIAIEARSAPEVTAVGIELAAIDAPAGTRRDQGVGAHMGDLGNMPVGVAVKRNPVGLGDPAERVPAAEGRLELSALGVPAGSTAARHEHGP